MRAFATLLLTGCVSYATSIDEHTGKVVVLPRRCDGCAVVRKVKVLDADGPRENRRVMMFDGGIVAEEPDDGPVTGAAVELDGTGQTLVPGLWDGHVHMMASDDGLGSSAYLPEALKGFVFSGVTSVLDMGSDGDTITALRRRIASADLIGPQVLAAGRFVTAPGGHPCTGYGPTVCSPVGAETAADEVVAGIAALKPDFVKIIIEAGGAPRPVYPRLSAADIAAVTVAAHARALKVTAHVSALQDVDDALAGHVDSLAHVPALGVLTDAQVDALVAQHVPVITTLSFYDGLPRTLDRWADFSQPSIASAVPSDVIASINVQKAQYRPSGPGAAITAAFREWLMKMNLSVQKLKAKGGTLIAGSDCGNFAVFHGPGLIRELELLVAAGLTTREAITAATAAPAEWVGQGAVVGRVRGGQRADLLLVRGDVEADITRLKDVVEVWVGGRRLDRSQLSVNRDRSNLYFNIAHPHPVGSFCLIDSECAPGSVCEQSVWQCFKTCALADAATCPADFGCWPRASAAADGICVVSDHCNPVMQNCPYAALFGTTCTPREADFTTCDAAGALTQGAACTAGACARGLVCADDAHCSAVCAPPGGTCPGVTSCMDMTSRYGQSVGLCR